MARVKAAEAPDLRALALDPLRNFRNETLTIPEWGDVKVVVRAMSAGDWLDYRHRGEQLVKAQRAEQGIAEDDNDTEVSVPVAPVYALVLARTLLREDGSRIFDDDDVPKIGAAFSPVHDRLVDKAFELSGYQIGPDAETPEETAGNA